MNENKPVKHGALWTVLFAVVSLFWIFPIVLVLINSFKQKAYISKNAFSLPAGKAFVGLENYVRGIETTQFFASFGWTLLITVGSVVLILVLHPFIKSLTDRLTDPALNIICAMLFVGIVSDLIVTVKGLLGTHAVFAEYAVLLQQKRRELSEKLRLGAEEGRERIRERGSEELAKLREAAELGVEEREKIRRTTEEERERFYAKLQMRLNAQQRRTINSFPQWKLTRNNEVLDGLREAMEKARKRRSSGKDEPAKTH